MRTIAIKPATASDIVAVAKLDAANYVGDSYNEGFLYQALAQWPTGFWVAKLGNEVVGYALMAPGHKVAEAWLMTVVVAVEGRGQGVGRKLCQACIDSARASQRNVITLSVAPTNQVAVQLYTTLGFVTQRVEPNFFGPGQARTIMQLSGAPLTSQS